MFMLAERLGQPVEEILEMSTVLFLEWMAFDEWRHQEQEFAEKAAALRNR